MGLPGLLVLRLVNTAPEALQEIDKRMVNRALGFCMLSRQACSLHCVLRQPMLQHPYKLFALLVDPLQIPDTDFMGPVCMFDELTSNFFKKFPERSRPISDDARAFLQCVAAAIDVDIATIEAKHASTRRISQLKGTQTWVPTLQAVNAEWISRQVSIQEYNFSGLSCRASMHKKERKKRQKRTPGKQHGAKGGGGGACRAFFHVHHQGRKMTASSIRETMAAFKSLLPEQRAYYEDLGKSGTLAWRSGNKAFADSAPRTMFPDAPLVLTAGENYVRDSDGVLVGAPVEPTMETLVPCRARDFASDIKKIRSKIYKAAHSAKMDFQARFYKGFTNLPKTSRVETVQYYCPYKVTTYNGYVMSVRFTMLYFSFFKLCVVGKSKNKYL